MDRKWKGQDRVEWQERETNTKRSSQRNGQRKRNRKREGEGERVTGVERSRTGTTGWKARRYGESEKKQWQEVICVSERGTVKTVHEGVRHRPGAYCMNEGLLELTVPTNNKRFVLIS